MAGSAELALKPVTLDAVRDNVSTNAPQLAFLVLNFLPLMMGFTSSPLPLAADVQMRRAQVSLARVYMTISTS